MKKINLQRATSILIILTINTILIKIPFLLNKLFSNNFIFFSTTLLAILIILITNKQQNSILNLTLYTISLSYLVMILSTTFHIYQFIYIIFLIVVVNHKTKPNIKKDF